MEEQKTSPPKGFALSPRAALWLESCRRQRCLPAVVSRHACRLEWILLPAGLHLLLTLEGRKLKLLHPGRNVFRPPLELKAGEVLVLRERPRRRRRRPPVSELPDLPTAAKMDAAIFVEEPTPEASSFQGFTAFRQRGRGFLGTRFF